MDEQELTWLCRLLIVLVIIIIKYNCLICLLSLVSTMKGFYLGGLVLSGGGVVHTPSFSYSLSYRVTLVTTDVMSYVAPWRCNTATVTVAIEHKFSIANWKHISSISVQLVMFLRYNNPPFCFLVM